MYKHVHAIGDSHVLHMAGKFHMHHIADESGQGATAHNLVNEKSTTNSRKQVFKILDALNPAEDIIVLCFGEVDCRIHITDFEMVQKTIDRYTKFIDEVRNRGFRVIVHEVIGAVPQNRSELGKQEDHLPQVERAKIVNWFNDLLGGWCDSRGVEFLELNATTDGILSNHQTSDLVHLDDMLAQDLYTKALRNYDLGKEVKIAVWCMNEMATFGRQIARVLNVPLFVDSPVGDVDFVYIIGMYDVPRYTHTLENTRFAKHRVIHWCGSDVLYLMNPERIPEATHLCGSETLRRELLEMGIEARVVQRPTPHHFPVTPLPEQKTVAFYMGGDGEKYGASVMRAVMECLPDWKFIAYAHGQYGYEALKDIVNLSTVYVRLTKHDGSMNSTREYLEAGRYTVTTGDTPFTKQVRPDDILQIVKAIRDIGNNTEPNYEAAEFYKDFNSVETYLDQMQGVFDE